MEAKLRKSGKRDDFRFLLPPKLGASTKNMLVKL
jgi:hypothetical protein